MLRGKSWFRITWSIRTLLLMTALVSIAIAWQVPRSRREHAVKTLGELGAILEETGDGKTKALLLPAFVGGNFFGAASYSGRDAWKDPRRIISMIGDVDTLESIAIEPGDLRQRSLGPWLHLGALRNVDIKNAVLSKANVEVIAALPALESLSLSYVYFEGDALDPLTRCKELRYLKLRHCSIGIPFDKKTPPTPNDDSESKASLELRTGNQIIPSWIDDATLPIVRRMKMIKGLSLDNLPVDTKKLESLRGMDSLEGLSLRNTDVDDSAIDVLLSFPNLKRVDLMNTSITRDGVVLMVRKSKIEEVIVDKELEKSVSNDLNQGERARVNPPEVDPFAQ